jgi:tRNA-2-methylthio-N6-dimethylallyladenosine synthase
MTERAIAAIAECEKVCPQVHLPLQSGSDRVLTEMSRTYTLDGYREIAAKLRAAIPEVALSTDLIVGFPGETEEEFEQTVAAMTEFRWDSAFLFKYSARPDTRAWRLDETVTEEEKGRRLQRLIDLQHRISGEINDGWLGREVEVLIESSARRNADQLYGRTPQFKAIVVPDDGTPAGTLVRARIVGSTPVTLFGVPVESPRPTATLLTIS